MKKDKMQDLLNSFAQKLLAIVTGHPNFRFNLTLPGYMLHHLDPFLLSKLNEFQKSGCLEWLTPGYTEPFLGFSPLWLSSDNIRLGLDTFEELLGEKPGGYVPPFSNWEPSAIGNLLSNGLHYSVLSRTLLPTDAQHYCGYWMTEHSGNAMVIIPLYTLHFYNAPSTIHNWVDHAIENSPQGPSPQLVALRYLVPLESSKNADPFKWLNSFAQALDTLLIKYQLNLLHELPTLAPPLGLQDIPPSLEFKQDDGENISSCSNYLHTFDMVGILQRKMMALAENIGANDLSREMLQLKKQLFFVQDINRYLPNSASGFPFIRDRFWSFEKLIEIEREILKKEKISGGQVRIADLLKNGTKSIVMSNKSIQVYIDHKNGGQIFELDYRDRSANLLAGYNPKRHSPPRILVPGKSCTSFIDHFLSEKCRRTDFINNTAKHFGDCVTGQFDYKVKKTSSSVKAILSRQSFISINDKQYPLTMEKVFGLEKNKPELSFAYQLVNHSLTTYAFKFAVETTFALPGVQSHQAEISSGKIAHNRLAWDRITFKDVTEWTLTDTKTGTAIQFITRKPVSVWCYPVVKASPYQGTTIVISTPVSLKENSAWSLMGKISCKKIPLKGDAADAI